MKFNITMVITIISFLCFISILLSGSNRKPIPELTITTGIKKTEIPNTIPNKFCKKSLLNVKGTIAINKINIIEYNPKMKCIFVNFSLSNCFTLLMIIFIFLYKLNLFFGTFHCERILFKSSHHS